MKIPLHIELSRQKKRLLTDRLSVSGQAIDAFVYLESKLYKNRYCVKGYEGRIMAVDNNVKLLENEDDN